MADRTPLDYELPSRRRRRVRRTRVPTWILLMAVVMALGAVLLLGSRRTGSRETSDRARCATNLRQIGLGCNLYAIEFGHVFPDSLSTLMTKQGLTADPFVCPSSTDSIATGTTSQQAAALAMPGRCSYIYVGAPLADQSSANCVVAYEDPANHEMAGANVLYADCRVRFEPLSTVVQLVPELEAGHNPPTIANISQKQAEALYAKTWKPKLTAMKTGVWAATLPRPTTQPAPAN